MEFDQTLTTSGFWGKDERAKFWRQKVKGQGFTLGSNMPQKVLFGFVSTIFRVLVVTLAEA